MGAISIAQSGMRASMMRLTASASNIANAQSMGAIAGDAAGDTAPRPYQPVRAQLSPQPGGGVEGRLVPVQPGQLLTYSPGTPYADARGMIATPNVDLAVEMVEQLSAKLAFEANLKVASTLGELDRDSIERWG